MIKTYLYHKIIERAFDALFNGIRDGFGVYPVIIGRHRVIEMKWSDQHQSLFNKEDIVPSHRYVYYDCELRLRDDTYDITEIVIFENSSHEAQVRWLVGDSPVPSFPGYEMYEQCGTDGIYNYARLLNPFPKRIRCVSGFHIDRIDRVID